MRKFFAVIVLIIGIIMGLSILMGAFKFVVSLIVLCSVTHPSAESIETVSGEGAGVILFGAIAFVLIRWAIKELK